MKRIFLTLAVITLASCQAQEKQFTKEALKEKLISLEGDESDFGSIIKRHEGKTILIEIWASWCGDCVKAMPLVKQTQAGNPDVEYIFISMDKSVDKWKEGITKHALEGVHYWAPSGQKGAFGKAIDLDWIPRYIIVDKKGKVALYRAVETDFKKINAILKEKTKA
jgi:thiol-disulfide isomerase/thioredoxin